MKRGDTTDRKIVAVHPQPDLYGAGKIFLEALSAVSDLCDIATVLQSAGALADAIPDNADVHVIPFPVLRRSEVRGIRWLSWFGKSCAWTIRLTKFLRDRRPDVIYLSTVTSPVWVVAAKLARVPVVCHVHESHEGSMTARRLLFAQLLLVRRIVAISKYVSTNISEAYPLLSERTRLIYNPIDETWSQAPRRSVFGESEVRLVVVGRVSWRKGQDVAISACDLLRQRGFNVHLRLVGAPFPGYEPVEVALRSQVLELQLGGQVHFVGHVDDPREIVWDSHIVLVPSRAEPFGLVALEGMCAGRPVVVARAGGLVELVEHGVTGLTCAPDDANSLANSIAELIDNPALAAELATQGQQAARSRFSRRAFAAGVTRTIVDAWN